MKRIKINFSEKQSLAIECAKNGTSFFLTGAAGVGKSETIGYIVDDLKRLGKKVAVTSSTGASAERIGGRTIHSFAGIRIGQGTCEELLELVLSNRYAVKDLQETDVWVMDEISMIAKELFTNLDYVARHVRNCLDKPFGGMQIIAVGDFFQLPPIVKDDEELFFAFESPSWDETFGGHVLVLDVVFRQTDPLFLKWLHLLRIGILDPDFKKALRKNARRKLDDDLIPTRLRSKHDEVNEINQRELNKLPGEEITFKAKDFNMNSYYERQITVDKSITLKVGAQVVMLKNDKDKYVNGSVGYITAIHQKIQSVEVQLLNGKKVTVSPQKFDIEENNRVKASRRALPMKLAWALTIHKAQGMTLDVVEIDLISVFSPAQTYTALSRAKTLEGLWVIGISKDVVFCNEKVKAFYDALKDGGCR